jgi:hypothetical protein
MSELRAQYLEPNDHRQHHIELHEALDELVADWITNTDGRPSTSTVLDLMRWSNLQTLSPTEKGAE